ncbi:alpha/beta hydrolase [Alteromonas halophila]|uniref:Alpha/beta hydrolase n=1 Tax=Alteromonas halophila TaxID=516698 RepID=A0A918JNE6_9ALTE|nr:alpha/beta hydrolase-fold protein [Alteromonas halophila]GGW88151.1 hypothetical protein GCM10007391_22430 [Alteromonas halophila]
MRSDFWGTALMAMACISACTGEPERQAEDSKQQVAQQQLTPSTMADNVTLLPQSVTFAGKPRQLWVYLPPGYATSSASYDVVYMHDGQNVFDAQTSYAGEWGVDETLNRLADEGYAVPLVVAIEHGGEARMQELSPWTNPEFGEAQGEAYLNFIINKVKPLIDGTYRTNPGAMSTTMMGSSMGGLMSHYALVARPDVFSKAAVFSPSFWFSEQAYHQSENAPLPETHRLLMTVGEKEGDKMVNGTQAMADLHLAQQHPQDRLSVRVVPGQSHNEAFWRAQVADALIWLNVVKQHEQ